MTQLLIKWLIKDPDDVHSAAARRRYGALAGGVGIVLNLLLSLGKFVAGTLAGSISVTADAFNNLSDAGSSVVTLVGFRMASKQADGDHPFGHGRIEYLSGLFVAVAILLVGVELLKSSIEKILHPQAVSFSWLTATILAVSILVKLWMSLFVRTLSRRIGSSAMAATATDSLGDAVATGAVLLGGLVGHFFRLEIDAWMGILVALFILRAGWGAAKSTLDPLLGQSPDPALVKAICDTVLAHPPVVGLHDLVIHDYGPGRSMMSLHAEVPMDANIMEIHDVIDAIERECSAKFHIETSIHTDPIATADEDILRAREQVAALVREIDEHMTIHDFRMTRGPLHTNLIFDVMVPYSVKCSDEEVKAAVTAKLREADPGCYPVIQVDRSYT